MKAENLKVGLKVVIKKCACMGAANYIGRAGNIDRVLEWGLCYVSIEDVDVLVDAPEIRKFKIGVDE